MKKIIVLILLIFIAGLAVQMAGTNCEEAEFERGDVVQHRLTGERAIIGGAFCSGGGEARKRMYEVSLGNDTTYWGQFEIRSIR